RRRGRPTKRTEPLRNAILALVNDGAWRATDGMPALGRLLKERYREPPSCDTLGRVVDGLYRLTGERALRREVRKPPAREEYSFPQKSKLHLAPGRRLSD